MPASRSNSRNTGAGLPLDDRLAVHPRGIDAAEEQVVEHGAAWVDAGAIVGFDVAAVGAVHRRLDHAPRAGDPGLQPFVEQAEAHARLDIGQGQGQERLAVLLAQAPLGRETRDPPLILRQVRPP